MSGKFVTDEDGPIKEIEELLTMYSQMGNSIFNKIKVIAQNAERENAKGVYIPTDLLKFLIQSSSDIQTQLLLNQMNTSQTQSINAQTSTTSQTSFVSATPSSPSNSIQIGKKKASIFSMKRKKESIKKMENTNINIDKIERNLAMEEKIRKRFSIRSNRVIKSLGLAPNFLLYEVLDKLPPIKVKPLTVNRPLTTIKGPGESSQHIMSYSDFASAISFSNYPKVPGRPYGEGDPICDRFNVILYENRVIFSVADGCNWGEMPRKAAKRATKNFNQFVSTQANDITTLRSASSVILAAFAEADRSIRESINELGPPPATTTLIGGLLAEVNFDSHNLSPRSAANAALASNWDGSPWIFIFACVGDCKCYHYSQVTKKLKDLTRSSRVDLLNATDPGGRIGGNEADLNNFSLSFHPCDNDDIIIILSDGMYDNFDPIQQGKKPRDFAINEDEWSNVSKELLHSIVDDYIVNFIEREIIPSADPLLKDIVSNCANFVSDFTSASRTFMEENPKSKLPSNLQNFPGKLDHSTCVAIRVGKISISYNDWVTSSDNNSRSSSRTRIQNDDTDLSSSSSSEKPTDETDSELIGSYHSIRKHTLRLWE